jgi:hypothetical protein
MEVTRGQELRETWKLMAPWQRRSMILRIGFCHWKQAKDVDEKSDLSGMRISKV